MNTQRFAIKLNSLGDADIRGPLFWAFTAWQGEYPDRLLSKDQAEREMARLIELDPRRATKISIVDVPEARERAKIFGRAYTGVFYAIGWDDLDAATQNRLRAELKIKGRAAGNAALVAAGYKPNP